LPLQHLDCMPNSHHHLPGDWIAPGRDVHHPLTPRVQRRKPAVELTGQRKPDIFVVAWMSGEPIMVDALNMRVRTIVRSTATLLVLTEVVVLFHGATSSVSSQWLTICRFSSIVRG
jgi:hypothetical protein